MWGVDCGALGKQKPEMGMSEVSSFTSLPSVLNMRKRGVV